MMEISMSQIFFGFLKNQVFPGIEVLDEEDTESHLL